MSEHSSKKNRNESTAAQPGGGLTLVDLVLFFWRYKWVVIAAVGLTVLLGLIHVLSRERSYEYSTTIELAVYQADNGTRAVEPVEDVVAKLRSSFIPSAIDSTEGVASSGNSQGVRILLSARRPENTNLIELSSQGKQEHADLHIRLHRRVLELLIEDQRLRYELEQYRLEREYELARIELEELEDERVQRVERLKLENQVAQARAELENLQDAEGLLEEQISALDVKSELVQSRLNELETYIEGGRENRERASNQAASGPDGMTLMLIDNSLQSDIERQARLEDQLLIEIPAERTRIDNSLKENLRLQGVQAERITRQEAELEKLRLDQQREVSRQRPVVKGLQARLESLRMTRAVLAPRRSLLPADTRSRDLLAVYVIAGMVLAVILAGLVSLIEQAARRLSA